MRSTTACVVLDAHDVETWLNVREHEPDERVLLLRPSPQGTLSHYGVDKAVGSVKNDGHSSSSRWSPVPVLVFKKPKTPSDQ